MVLIPDPKNWWMGKMMDLFLLILLSFFIFALSGFGQPSGYQNNYQMVEEENDHMTENLFGKVMELKKVSRKFFLSHPPLWKPLWESQGTQKCE